MIIFYLLPFLYTSSRSDMIKLTNLYRKIHGLKELKVIEPLRLASELQANTMCKLNKLTHKNTDKRKKTLKNRMEFFNFKYSKIGEIIAKQQNDDFKEVFKVWSKSPLHKKNILGNYNFTGVATCVGKDKNRYWVQVFASGDGKWKGSHYNENDKKEENESDMSDGNDNKYNGERDDNKYNGERDDNKYKWKDDKDKRNDRGKRNKRDIKEDDSSKREENDKREEKDKRNKRDIKEDDSSKKEEKDKRNDRGKRNKRDNKDHDRDNKNHDKKDKNKDKNNDKKDENFIFLVKDNEDTKKIRENIPENYSLKYKGDFKKYVAEENSRQCQQANKKDFLNKYEKDKTPQSGYENILKKILKKLEDLESKNTPRRANGMDKNTSGNGLKDFNEQVNEKDNNNTNMKDKNISGSEKNNDNSINDNKDNNKDNYNSINDNKDNNKDNYNSINNNSNGTSTDTNKRGTDINKESKDNKNSINNNSNGASKDSNKDTDKRGTDINKESKDNNNSINNNNKDNNKDNNNSINNDKDNNKDNIKDNSINNNSIGINNYSNSISSPYFSAMPLTMDNKATVTTTVLKTVYNYQTVSSIEPTSSTKDEPITMTVSIDEKTNENDLNKKIQSILNSIKKRDDEPGNLNKFLKDLIKNKEDIDIGDPEYIDE